MGNGNRKQITFDLRQDALKQHYPHKTPVLNPQYYKKAYSDIQRFMTKSGFDHRQYSVYTSKERMTTLDVIGLMERLAEQMPWLNLCVNEIDVTNIGTQHGLKQTLEKATHDLDLDLDSSMDAGELSLEIKEETDTQVMLDIPAPRKKTGKHKHGQER